MACSRRSMALCWFSLIPLAFTLGCLDGAGAPQEEVEQVQAPVIGGWSLAEWPNSEMWARRRVATVRIENTYIRDHVPGKRGLCTGTLVAPQVVLTAAHCLTHDGNKSGNLVDPATVYIYDHSVEQQASDGMPPSCIAPYCRKPTSTGLLKHPETYLYGVNDAALIFLNGALAYRFGFSTAIDRQNPDRNFGEALAITGYGMDDAGAAGNLRWGYTYLTTAFYDLRELVTCQEPAAGAPSLAKFGDSGGPLWVPGFPPHAVTGIASITVGGCDDDNGNTQAGIAYAHPTYFRHWARTQIANRTPSFTDNFDRTALCPSSPCSWLSVEPAQPDVAASWSMSGGKLRQARNAGSAIAYEGTMRIYGGHIFDNFTAETHVTSPDNDQAGIAFRYVDKTHYYLLHVNEQNGLAQLLRRNGDTHTVLAERTVAVDWASGVRLYVFANDEHLSAQIVTSRYEYQLLATDKAYPVGAVGVYNRYLVDAAYENLKVTVAPPAADHDW